MNANVGMIIVEGRSHAVLAYVQRPKAAANRQLGPDRQATAVRKRAG